MNRPPASSPEALKKNKSSKKKENKKNKGDNNKQNGDANQSTPQHTQSLNLKSPMPVTVTKMPDVDIDDAASNGSFESISSHRRRRARGGRKKKSQLEIVSEGQQNPHRESQGDTTGPSDRWEKNPWAAEQQLNGQVDDGSTSSATVRDEQQEERVQAKTEPENARPMTIGTQEPEHASPKKSDTEVKAFNIRKANPDGDKPIGPRIQMSGGGGQSSATREQSQQSHEGNPTTQAASGKATQSGRSSEERNVSIKVDLNLEVEVLLKAKIKGEVMLTFL